MAGLYLARRGSIAADVPDDMHAAVRSRVKRYSFGVPNLVQQAVPVVGLIVRQALDNGLVLIAGPGGGDEMLHTTREGSVCVG